MTRAPLIGTALVTLVAAGVVAGTTAERSVGAAALAAPTTGWTLVPSRRSPRAATT